VSVVLIDAAPGEQQASHSHPVEEVTIVQAGAATANGRLRAIAVHGATEIVTYPT